MIDHATPAGEECVAHLAPVICEVCERCRGTGEGRRTDPYRGEEGCPDCLGHGSLVELCAGPVLSIDSAHPYWVAQFAAGRR